MHIASICHSMEWIWMVRCSVRVCCVDMNRHATIWLNFNDWSPDIFRYFALKPLGQRRQRWYFEGLGAVPGRTWQAGSTMSTLPGSARDAESARSQTLLQTVAKWHMFWYCFTCFYCMLLLVLVLHVLRSLYNVYSLFISSASWICPKCVGK
jgi:hypothetical protein